jgi:hypothetical protein
MLYNNDEAMIMMRGGGGEYLRIIEEVDNFFPLQEGVSLFVSKYVYHN